ncbi:hypothetical protein K7X08_002787 [Anisodus acutangulus]|uniref:Uncharacterized protein n=1 Tax=Anisodus acutangulus TaxID=402998 RepID=A0A9Q1MHJ2_9SOLA|nr:hypothetical protein K7X08_002787 [Anisodus acutangulus]
MKCLKPQVYSPVTKFDGGSYFETFHHYFKKVYNSGFDSLLGVHHLGLFIDSESEEDRTSLLMSLRKLAVPFLLVIIVLMNWDHPILIATKVTLLLLTTKPSPLSVNVLVEQKVEVADYLFLSLAKVELKDQEFTLVGILGRWWSLPVSSWQEASSILKCKILKNLS